MMNNTHYLEIIMAYVYILHNVVLKVDVAQQIFLQLPPCMAEIASYGPACCGYTVKTK